jgi:hypothetical protein
MTEGSHGGRWQGESVAELMLSRKRKGWVEKGSPRRGGRWPLKVVSAGGW